MLENPIARITAAIILVISILSVTGIFGTIQDSGRDIVLLLIGVASTFLFVAQKKAVGNVP